ncbi:MAG: ferric reductase-like transmembrane domain-containing protein [Candidatus Kerfeldbacteria bacterium]|nr:ferric reductase-like transmembrane domain-containing protein [Candidatus Kerfeldbacteria bacterium]
MNQLPVNLRMWRSAILLAFGILVVLVGYVYLYNDGLTALAWSQAVAGTAALMIGISFALSGIGYWWDFLDARVGYRKYYGLVGYYFALLHSVMLLFIFPNRYWYGFFENFFTPNIILGLIAMTILTMMAIVSNNWAMRRLGPIHWRQLLRLGYLAYALLIVRALYIEGGNWLAWLRSFDGLPPPRLIVSICAAAVIIFRGSVFISKKARAARAQTLASQPAPASAENKTPAADMHQGGESNQ